MKILINGTEVTAEPEDTIMEASKRAGIFIPGLCYHSAVEPDNCCRLCMVEAFEYTGGERPKPKLVAACAYKVREGLIVETTSDRVTRILRTLLKLMYSQAPENPAVTELLEYYSVIPEKKYDEKEGQCILCGLCVKVCRKTGASSISTISRGTTKKVSTPYGKPEESCIGCASCAEICPTKCIEIEDNEAGRTIWNKHFEWVRCERCGAVITTKEHFAASNSGNPEAAVLCPVCKKLHITDEMALVYGE